MSFDETRGVSALELIDRSSERELAGILATFGEERRAGRIAKAIVAAREEGRHMTSAELAASFGGAAIELTNRGNLQVRGVRLARKVEVEVEGED